MLTESQRAIFTRIIDLNWEFTQEKNSTKKFELFEQLNAAKSELKESMGVDAYNDFINKGKQMFSPKN